MNCPVCQTSLAPESIYGHHCGARIALGPDGGRVLLQRPLAVSMLAVVSAIGGLVVLVIAMVTLFAGDGGSPAVVLGALGAFSLASGIGAWRLKGWGRILQIAQACLGLLLVPIGTIISILVLVYLVRPGVKILFSEKSPAALTPAEISEVAKVHRDYRIPAITVALVALVFVVVTGILAAIAIPLYANIGARARIAKAQADVRVLSSAVALYVQHCGAPPPVAGSDATCAAAPAEPASGDAPTALSLAQKNRQGLTAGPFLKAIPTAPAGFTQYRYVVSGGSYRFCTTGDGTTASSDGTTTTCP